MRYSLKDKELIFEDYPKEDNLYIENFWNMKDTVGHTDSCVLVRIIDENFFRFTTFSGMSYTMKLDGEKINCIEKKITK